MVKNTTSVQSKELAPIKGKISKMTSVVNELVIKDEPTLKVAVDLLSKIKTTYKLVKERMEAPVKRAYQAYKDIKTEQDQTFGVFISDCENAERIVKDKMIVYSRKVEADRLAAEKKLADRVEAGTLKVETAAKKLEAMPDKPTHFVGNKGSMTIKKIKKFRVEDLSKLPIQYHLPNEVEIRRQMLAGVELPGVVYWEDDSVSAS